MGLKEVLSRRNAKTEEESADLQGLISIAIEEKLNKSFENFKKEKIDELNTAIQEATIEAIATTYKGDKGDKGDRGEDGRDGVDGQDGKDGRDGKDGKDGINGKDGKDAIVDKRKEKELTVDSVIGLKEALRSLEQAIRSGRKSGGGMGNPVHQSFSGDGSATSFTLSNNVAANGSAAWIFYNGQMVVNSTHWSVSGKTLTLTFTPEDGSSIDVTYIRT